MPMIPAICDNCGAKFSSGFFVENVENLTMRDNTAGPCPVCGGMGRTKNGVFNVVNGVIEQLKNLDYTKEELQELSDTIKEINKETDNPLDIEQTINNANPKFSSVLELLPKNREEKRSDIKFIIPILLSIIGFLINLSSNSTINFDINIDQFINVGYENPENITSKSNYEINKEQKKENFGKASVAKVVKKEPIRVQKIGRNQLCPCGSGVKFKKCHGK